MALEIGSSYILRFVSKGFELVYRTTILDYDGTLITFNDRFGKTMTYNQSMLMTAEKILAEDVDEFAVKEKNKEVEVDGED